MITASRNTRQNVALVIARTRVACIRLVSMESPVANVWPVLSTNPRHSGSAATESGGFHPTHDLLPIVLQFLGIRLPRSRVFHESFECLERAPVHTFS